MIQPRTRRAVTDALTLLGRARMSARLDYLPRRCEMLLAGLDNAESDATLVFDRLPYGDVMALALRNATVRAALERLPADWDGWVR